MHPALRVAARVTHNYGKLKRSAILGLVVGIAAAATIVVLSDNFVPLAALVPSAALGLFVTALKYFS